jgi:hypothetical protein
VSTQPEAKQVPLVERLESVPVDARLAVDDGPYSTSFYAVGAMAHEAAAELRRLHAENERLHRFELANNLWHEKTDWVQETAQPLELGRHRADVLKQRIERLHAVNQELLEALKQHGAHHGNCDYMILLTSLPPMRKPCSCGLHAAIAKATGEKT